MSALVVLFIFMVGYAEGAPQVRENPLPLPDFGITQPALQTETDDNAPCEFLQFHSPTLANAFKLPSTSGEQLYAVRFSPESGCLYPVGSARILVWGGHYLGTPGLRIYLWSGDGWGFPGEILDSVDVPYEDLPASLDWVTVDFGTPPHIFEPYEYFYVGCRMIGNEGDTLHIISDNADGGYADDDRGLVFYQGSWITMGDAYGDGYVFFIEASTCHFNHVPVTVNVPIDYVTIQEAIDHASDNDTIILADGIYAGTGNRNLVCYGLPLTIKSANGPENCIIDCEGLVGEDRIAFTFRSCESAGTLIQGITIRNAISDGFTSAIRIEDDSPTIRNCIFKNNHALYGGGLVVTGQSHPIIENCLFVDNSANFGGAVASYYGASPEFINCTMVDNDGYIGAVSASSDASPQFERCVLAFNTGDIAFNHLYDHDYAARPHLYCTDIFGNSGGDWVGAIEPQLAAAG
ncbi:MAG: right-handed parallel beta-helix repeat-containing protein, partial [Bacteroidetes bacterium]|nr:right-handed parallel beta-helix repeat-containing protein [Bacteroidota bacterium]